MPLVKLYANLRKLAGTKEVFIPGGTVGEVLAGLAGQNPSLEQVLFTGGRLRPQVVVTLNGHNMIDDSVQIREGDVIAVFPPIAGG